MGLINWIFDIYQHSKIDEARREAAEARAQVSMLHTSGGQVDVRRLEQAIGELALSVKTVQRTMVDKGLCTHEEFATKLQQVDLEDGRADGRSPV